MLVKSQVKYIQSLSQKKLRDAEGVFVAEGPKIVGELLSSPRVAARSLFALQEWIDANTGHPALQYAAVVTESELERISSLTTPNQVLGIFQQPSYAAAPDLRGKISLMLDTIQDPGNLGTIIRCADWFGIQHVICSRDSADIFNQKVVQATMGSIARVRVLYEDLEAFIGHHAIPVYAATLTGTDIRQLPVIQEGIMLIGNESRGIQESLLAQAQHRITIPRRGEAESLNAAVAAGIILAHVT